MADIVLSIATVLLFLLTKEINKNDKNIGEKKIPLIYFSMLFLVGIIAGIVDDEIFFKKTALSVILIWVMAIICINGAWKSVHRFNKKK